MGKIIDYINNNLDIDQEYQRIFSRKIPTGKMYCLWHDNTNTPAAKRYGNVIHCFSCGKNYTVYDLLKKYDPKRIEEIKSSIIIDTTQQSREKVPRVEIDRSQSIDEVISLITKPYSYEYRLNH